MKLSNIEIYNFKSIDHLDFKIKKYGNSYATMLIGINESGKSNVLEAMSLIASPSDSINYKEYHNQKDDENRIVSIKFHLGFVNKNDYMDILKQLFKDIIPSFNINNIVKHVYTKHNDTAFSEEYSFDLINLQKNLYIKKVSEVAIDQNGTSNNIDFFSIKGEKDDEYILLDEKVFLEYFSKDIINIIKSNEPKPIFWKPSPEYLISSENLIEFSNNISSKKVLKNLFGLAGYHNDDLIKDAIDNVTDGSSRSKLMSKLTKNLNDYIKSVWKHDIEFIVDITENGKLDISVRDKGKNNIHDRLPITRRSEGAKHFLSLILSLSIENKNNKIKNQLILIDEPEAHLHPSGIKDLGQELIRIGESNYLFISTHSPFLIDKQHKERNIILKKDDHAYTEKKLINNYTNIIDDEVLQEAFGILPFRDLLNPNSILVEGLVDKEIIKKTLSIKGFSYFGITNGHGSNIDTLAAKLNDSGQSILVILDDDSNGKSYKKKIIKLGIDYSTSNVFTIRDIEGRIIEGGTIEDTLDQAYVMGQFKIIYKKMCGNDNLNFNTNTTEPIMKQIREYLTSEEFDNVNDILEDLKIGISNNFKPNKKSLSEKNPLLESLVNNIITKLPDTESKDNK